MNRLPTQITLGGMRYKGRPSKKITLAQWPHHVRVELNEDRTIGIRTIDLDRLCFGVDHGKVPDYSPGCRQAIIFGFRSPEDAERFERAIAPFRD